MYQRNDAECTYAEINLLWRWADGKLARGAFFKKYGIHANPEENINILIDQRIVVQNVNSSKENVNRKMLKQVIKERQIK